MAKKQSVTAKKRGRSATSKTFPCIPIKQSGKTLYFFSAKASYLWKTLSINRRVEDKDEGYQRALAKSRVESIAQVFIDNKVIPVCIVVSIKDAKLNAAKNEITLPKGSDIGWVIDGQHRLAGAHLAAERGVDVELGVVAFLDLAEAEQIEQFITINREARGVPTSLLLDLLKYIPNKKPGDLARERASDIGNSMRKDPTSALFGRITTVTAPSAGQISLTNFSRKVSPFVNAQTGILKDFTLEEQKKILENFFTAFQQSYKEEWNKKGTIFFKTIGFGAICNVFEFIFTQTTTRLGGFRVNDIRQILDKAGTFDFDAWRSSGSGSKAELDAAKDLLVDLRMAVKGLEETSDKKLKLD
ncbi:MAG: DGQHR domain-containing protein [Parvibaculaceae bacterium]